MTAQLHSWDPPCEPDTIWYTLGQLPRCCIIDNGEWRTIALSEDNSATYIGSDWQNLPQRDL